MSQLTREGVLGRTEVSGPTEQTPPASLGPAAGQGPGTPHASRAVPWILHLLGLMDVGAASCPLSRSGGGRRDSGLAQKGAPFAEKP